ncbi:Holliday junction resolvase RuvX [Sodalis sp. CWE]|uniref:Holliday junction resolvase RuvX n=1 Tax=Sodalis sp. CWE TaxID=2803816 RepID=UPI001C7DE1EF|nr:Holliday junction resolvase RuvX [Sodalis sp. CWE]MBX4180898.1 Holliday junction resolvase RuvX [Sodalis sp. CWE]
MVTVRNVIAFDFGIKNIGVAIGQYVTCTASPLTTIKARDGIPNWKHIKTLFHEWEPVIAVVGLPLNVDGSEQILTAKARTFATSLRNRFGVFVKLHDERFSTVQARSNLFERGGYCALEKRRINSESAVIILESQLKKPFTLK